MQWSMSYAWRPNCFGDCYTFKWLLIGIGSWRTMLPRLASKTIAKQFLQEGASIWVLRTSQVGGYDPDIEPVAPTPIGV